MSGGPFGELVAVGGGVLEGLEGLGAEATLLFTAAVRQPIKKKHRTADGTRRSQRHLLRASIDLQLKVLANPKIIAVSSKSIGYLKRNRVFCFRRI